MLKDKLAELMYLQSLFEEKVSESERRKMMGRVVARMICTFAKRLIKDVGYCVATTIIQRELKEIGKEDARRLKEIFGFKEETYENASKILKMAAMILGLKLNIMGNEKIIQECPQRAEALKLKELFICKIKRTLYM